MYFFNFLVFFLFFFFTITSYHLSALFHLYPNPHNNYAVIILYWLFETIFISWYLTVRCWKGILKNLNIQLVSQSLNYFITNTFKNVCVGNKAEIKVHKTNIDTLCIIKNATSMWLPLKIFNAPFISGVKVPYLVQSIDYTATIIILLGDLWLCHSPCQII